MAKTTPTENHLSDTITIDGKKTNVGLDGVPIGPQYLKADGEFFLGADPNGRDIMVRLLYGGRNSLMIGVAAALMTTILSVLGVIAATSGLERHRDPVGARHSVVVPGGDPGRRARRGARARRAADRADQDRGRLARGADLHHRLVYIPYMARPVRGQVLSLREKEFVEAARAQGAGPLRIMFSEVVPNLASTVLVFFTLLIANAVLLEAALVVPRCRRGRRTRPGAR